MVRKNKYKMLKSLIFGSCLTLFLVGAFPSVADEPVDRNQERNEIQLVQSVPKETGLADSSLPQTAQFWVQMIREAKKTIDVGQFYLTSTPGSSLEPVIRELRLAGERGVRIRFMVSDALLEEYQSTVDRIVGLPNTELRVYSLKGTTDGIIHAKYWVIDHQAVFIGSQNFDWRALEHIHETGVFIRNASVAQKVARIFEIDWALTQEKKSSLNVKKLLNAKLDGSDSMVEVVASPPFALPSGVKWSLRELIRLLGSAKKRIRVQLLSYAPGKKDGYWGELDNALRAAAARGVKVQLMVSNWNLSKWRLPYLKSLQVLPGIEVGVVSIPEWSGGFIPFARTIHSKLTLIDDHTLVVGTSNWAEGYFYKDRNIEVILRDPATVSQGSDIFDRVWESQYRETIDLMKQYEPPQVAPPKPKQEK